MRSLVKSCRLALIAAMLSAISSTGQTKQTTPASELDDCRTAFGAVLARTPLDSEIEAYRRCSKGRPKAGFPHQNLGILYEAQENWELADKEFRIALSLGLSTDLAKKTERELRVTDERLHQSASERAHAEHLDRAARAKRYLDANQFLDAVTLARALTIDPSPTFKDFALLGVIEFAMKDYPSAIRDLLRAKQDAPTSMQPEIDLLVKKAADENQYLRLTTMGQLAVRNHDATQAGDLFAAAWRLHPERADAGFAAITCYLTTPRSNRSLSILDALASSADSSVAARAVAIRTSLANIDKSIYEPHREARNVIASLLAKYKAPEDLSDISGKKLAALDHDVQQALVLDPHLVLAHRLLAFCLMREKKYSQAAEQYRAILKDNPRARVWFWLAWALWKAGQTDDAKIALSSDRSNPAPVDASLRGTLVEELEGSGK
jgi:tetratricopeptide (TPR) repeat protein